jgi:N6-L-threonylcarbamoyladenine synthase
MIINILAIESSCDETSASIIQDGKVLNNVIASQTVHQKYGGVVPELASRAHQLHIVNIVNEALQQAGISANELSAVACTRGPGLLGSLLVGVSYAKALAWSLNVPLIDVHHMEAHVLAHFIDDPKPTFPFLCLTVSGGHTQIVRVRTPLEMEVLGETMDDAVGEAFDKAAKIMGLPYPGGPLIDRYAAQGDPRRFDFPGSDVPGLNFSFSGIKTAFLYFLQEEVRKDAAFIEKNLPDLCASLQYRLIQMLMKKTELAVRQTGIRQVAIAGGVAANRGLRAAMHERAAKQGWQVFVPALQYCTDNAAMIAMAAHFRFQAGRFATLELTPQASWDMSKATAS